MKPVRDPKALSLTPLYLIHWSYPEFLEKSELHLIWAVPE